MTIQRYFIGIARKDNDLEKIMTTHYTEEPDDEGLYVLYTDYLAALAENQTLIDTILATKNEEIAELQEKLKQWEDMFRWMEDWK